jgi:3-deoxy-D-manno-octulosonic-acid transferase
MRPVISGKAVPLLFMGCYQLLGWLFFSVGVLPYILYRCVTGRGLAGLGQRLGFLQGVDPGAGHAVRIWLHGSSVGEVQAAKALLRELRRILPEAAFILSVMTEQGLAVASRQLAGQARIIYAPLDLIGVVDRVLKNIRPSYYICLETELWPNMLYRAHRRGVRLLLLNGRMSERSFQRYRKVSVFMADLLRRFEAISVIDDGDAERYLGLGAPADRVVVVGNAKYDFTTENCTESIRVEYNAILGLTGQPLLVAGSTHTGEEEMLARVFQSLKTTEAGRELLWVVAPRHLNRVAEVADMLNRRGITVERFSEVRKHGRRAEVILVDVMGELAKLYSVATVVFCGGSLVERGGHNVMEAAACGNPVFYGPSMKDFADAAQLLESARAGFPVRNIDELTEKIRYLLHSKKEYEDVCRRARETAMKQQGSARRQALLVKKILAA